MGNIFHERVFRERHIDNQDLLQDRVGSLIVITYNADNIAFPFRTSQVC